MGARALPGILPKMSIDESLDVTRIGPVPYIIPADWKRWPRILSMAAVGRLVITTCDLVMDPIMVAGGHWIWDVNGAYYGISLQNFRG